MDLELLNKTIKILQKDIKTKKLELKKLIEQRNKIEPTQNKYKCLKCNKNFVNNLTYTYHKENVCAQDIWKCSMCSYVAKSKNFLKRHELCCTKKWCPHCKTYRNDRKKVLVRHIEKCKLATEQESDVKTETKENSHSHPAESSQSQTDNLPDDDGCKLEIEQESDVKTEIKEILPAHHDEPSQLQPVHLHDDDVSQTHLDQSVHNT